ncbi:MAG: hypothetical protein N3F63_04425 [Thermoplasmata archaeon]|nr:hypothetical protein [Thermoplasmata archaeon]
MNGGEKMNVIKMFDENPSPIDLCVVGCGGAGINTLREIKIETPRIKKVAINLTLGGSLLSAAAQHRIYLSEQNLEEYTSEDVYHLCVANYKKITEAVGEPDVIVVITALRGRTGMGVAKALKEIYEHKLVLVIGYAPFCFEGNFDLNKAIDYLSGGNIWLIDNQLIADLSHETRFMKVVKIANQMADALVEHVVNGFTGKSIEMLKKHPVKGRADLGMGTSLLQALNDIEVSPSRAAFVSVKVPEKELFSVEHFAKYIEETGAFAREKVLLSSFSGFRTEILAVKEIH